MEGNDICLRPEALATYQLLKRKYSYYASFLATLTSRPLLFRACSETDLKAAVFVKFASILAKVLDNINDSLHSPDEMITSQETQLSIFLGGNISYRGGDDYVAKAENAAYQMTLWGARLIGECASEARNVYEIYQKDV